MLEEPAKKLLVAEGHHTALAVMSIILPSKRHVSVGHTCESMVGDRDAMGVASQIMQHVFRSAEGRLGIDDPVLPIEPAQEDGEALLVVKWHALAEEAQLIAGKEAP